MDEQKSARQSLWMLLASFLFAAMGVAPNPVKSMNLVSLNYVKMSSRFIFW